MARKSRKHPQSVTAKPSRDTVGYICLSVRNNDPAGSIENQKHIIEEGGGKIKSRFLATISTTVLAGDILIVQHFRR